MPLSRSRRTAKFVLDRLRVNVTRQLANQFPDGNDGPRAILSLINGLLDTGELYLEKSLTPGLSQDKAGSHIADTFTLSKVAYSLFNGLHGTTMDDLPYPVVAPLQRWLDQLLQVKSTAVFRAQLVVNYEVETLGVDHFTRFRHASASLTKAINETKWPIRFITLPAKAFGILPHFAIVAHEIGHTLIDRLTPPADHPLGADLIELQKKIETRLGRFDQQVLGRFKFIFGKWYEELCADAFMIYLTGPAGFFSLCEVFDLFSVSPGYRDTHPAASMRRAIAHRQLIKAGYGPVFEKYSGMPLTETLNSPLMIVPKDSDEIETNARAQHDLVASSIIAELHFYMPKVEDGIYRAVRDELESISKHAVYSAKQYECDLENHLDPILAAIPPIETGKKLEDRKPTEFASILNVGWVAVLSKIELLRVKVPQPDTLHAAKLERLHSLLLKAVELSEARRDWQSA